jgi:hypothetical protein
MSDPIPMTCATVSVSYQLLGNRTYFCSRKLINHDLSVSLSSSRSKRRIVSNKGYFCSMFLKCNLSAQRLAECSIFAQLGVMHSCFIYAICDSVPVKPNPVMGLF